jgi:hypothetical protein
MIKVTYTDVVPVVEALKEMARVALIAIVPLLIEGLSAWAINWKAIAIVAGVAVLRAVDKYLHLEGKITGNETETKGLTQF